MAEFFRSGRALSIALILALSALPLAAEPAGLRILSHKAYARLSEVVKPIFVEVRVTNEGATPSPNSLLLYTFAPVPPSGYEFHPGVVDSFYPREIEQPIEPPLEPGETRTFKLQTPYYATNAFSTAGHTLYASIIPELTGPNPTRVLFDAELKPLP